MDEVPTTEGNHTYDNPLTPNHRKSPVVVSIQNELYNSTTQNHVEEGEPYEEPILTQTQFVTPIDVVPNGKVGRLSQILQAKKQWHSHNMAGRGLSHTNLPQKIIDPFPALQYYITISV